MATHIEDNRATADGLSDPSSIVEPPQQAPVGRTAFDDLKHMIGIYKDDPLARKVMDGVVANRHGSKLEYDPKTAEIEEAIMATQIKERIVPTSDAGDASEDGGPRLLMRSGRTAFDRLGHLCGKYKDNPRIREILDDVVASRHADRRDDDQPE
jgi:hypothetical protein